MTCGTPTPATTRVVQIEPGPTPTFTASAPALMSACAPARVATFPPMISMVDENFLMRSIASSIGMALVGAPRRHLAPAPPRGN